MAEYIGKSGSFSLMRNLNLEKVYRTVVLNAPISRADISRLTGLNKVTVSNAIRDLIEADIISEEGIVSAENGRPPMMLMLSETFGILIGVEISGISTNVVITDLRGNILEKTIRDPKLYGPDELVEYLRNLVDSLEEKHKTTHGVVGIGVAFPHDYKHLERVSSRSPLAIWKGVDAQNLLDSAFPDIQIEIMNTTGAATIGEVHFGSSDINTYLAYIHGNWTLKMDMYGGGGTYSLNSPFSGELGNTIRDNDTGEKLNSVVTMKALVDKLYPNTSMTRLEAVLDIHRRQKKGDKEVDSCVREMIDSLAIALYNVIMIFAPEAICIGGYLGATLALGYEGVLNDKLDELLGDKNKGRKVTTSQFGVFNVGFGCVSWIRDNIISYIFDEE